MPSVFWMFLLASLVHVGEEYFFPGGFIQIVQRFNPRFAPVFTTSFAFWFNSAFLLLVLTGALIGERSLAFSLSMAALLFVNGLTHLIGAIITRQYVPGMVSGLLLYIPLSVNAFCLYFASGRIDIVGIVFAGSIGLLFQLIPLLFIAASRRPA